MRKYIVLSVCALCLAMACSCAWGDVPLDEAHFPDANFREYLTRRDVNDDGSLSDNEIANIVAISLYSYRNTASLKGIEYLTALNVLAIDNCQITELDLSKNIALASLSCMDNQLTTLDLSNNTALNTVLCNDNQLTSLKLGNNTALRILYCFGNALTDLDISGCTHLQNLMCNTNPLGKLDVTHNPELRTLYCWLCDLTELDLSRNVQLADLRCPYNALTALDVSNISALQTLDCSGNMLTVLDLAQNTQLVDLTCTGNPLTGLDLSNNTLLTRLQCGNVSEGANLDTLDLRNNTRLVELDCSNNRLTALDLSHNPLLAKVSCGFNNLTSLTLGNNASLAQLLCYFNAIETLDLSGCSSLSTLDCQYNNLTALDLSGCPKLAILNCSNNAIMSLNTLSCPRLAVLLRDDTTEAAINPEVTNRTIEINATNFPDDVFRSYVMTDIDRDGNGMLDPEDIYWASLINLLRYDEEIPAASSLKGMEFFPALTTIACSNNSISELDLSNCPLLASLYFDGNRLTELDISNNPLLTSLACDGNRLTELDISKCPLLTSVNLDNNELTEFDASNHLQLAYIYCSYNNLTRIDVSNCPALNLLGCESNDLTALDVSNHPMLQVFDCSHNRIRTLDLNADDLPVLYGIGCTDNGLESLALHNFTNLETIECFNNNLTELDLSGNPNLYLLWAWDNKLERLNVSNTAISNLGCARNPLTEVNASNCTRMKQLWCYETNLTNLDISNCPALEVLSVYKNNLTHLNLSGNTALRTLNCWDNQLATLDVRHCTSLVGLFCSGNQLSDIDLKANTQLQELSCARNNIRTLDLSGNEALTELYCYDNRLQALDLSHNSALTKLACSDNEIIELDLSSVPGLVSIDCSANYLSRLDLTDNESLEVLNCKYTTLRSIDVSGLSRLAVLNLTKGSLTTLDISGNKSLKSFDCTGSNFEGLYIAPADDIQYPYQTDMRLYVGNNIAKASNIQAFDRTGGSVAVSSSDKGVIMKFAAMPVRMTYDYDTGSNGNAIHVAVSIPTRSFIYLPKVEPSVYGLDEYVHSPDVSLGDGGTAIVTYAAHYVGHASLYDVINASDDVYEYDSNYTPNQRDNQDTASTPSVPESPDNTAAPSGSSGGGCNSGFGVLAAMVLACLPLRKRGAVFALVVLGLTAGTIAGAEVRQSDYTLPIQLEAYTPAGTWTTDFQLTPEIVNTVAAVRGISADKVRNYSEIASGTWEVEPSDLYNLARNGEYGGVTLPLTQSGTGDNFYVILCTFSSDVKPGELLSVQGFEVSADTRESVYSREHSYAAASWVTLDDTFTRIEAVPENRRVYLAVSFRPEYVNTGILTVIRGTYVEEDNPLARLDPDIAQRIADDLGISLDKLQYVSRAYLSDPREPTPAMLDYVKSNDREIILNMPTVSIDAGYEGMYFHYTLPDDVWEEVQGKDFSEYTIYALNDSEVSASGQRVKGASILGGLVSLWELNGGKMDSFTAQDFLIAGLLQASRPFSFYLAKMLIMLLLGGCNSGINPVFVNAVILGLIVLKFPRRH